MSIQLFGLKKKPIHNPKEFIILLYQSVAPQTGDVYPRPVLLSCSYLAPEICSTLEN